MNKNIDASQETERLDGFSDDQLPNRRPKKQSRRRDIENLLDARQLQAQIDDFFDEESLRDY